VTFHNKLGSQRDRIDRIATLARRIAPIVGADPDQAAEAAQISKADLRSEMVGEFPELQGLMGRYYALVAGRDAAVAAASEEHWKPQGPSDMVPTAPVSVAVALADKLDTLTCFWAIDEKPTGSKDPFALRRAALGVIRLVLENDLRTNLIELFLTAIGEIPPEGWLGEYGLDVFYRGDRSEVVSPVVNNLLSFFHDRLKFYLKDQNIRHDVIDACIAMPGNDDLTLLVKRAQALQATLETDDGENLIQGFKRANNILMQAEEKDGVEYSFGADIKFAEDPAEKDLFNALDTAEAQIAPAMAAEGFGDAMAAMATLRAPIDRFFTDVQVNSESQIIRRNRLNMLSRIRQICSSVADLTKIEG
jgi:glycyl-tRNA synthetase beta chain